MNKNDIQLLYQYDRWANERMLRAALTLNNEQFTRNLGGGFGSVRDTLVHILGGAWIWLAYWKHPPASPPALSDLIARRNAAIAPSMFPDVAALRLKWNEVESEQVSFVQRLTDESLARLIPFRSTQVKLEHLLQHVVNHSTYHRGQVALMMRQLGQEPLATDYHSFLVDGTHEPAETH